MLLVGQSTARPNWVPKPICYAYAVRSCPGPCCLGIESFELAKDLVEWEGDEYIADLLSYWAWDDAAGLQDTVDDISDPEIHASAEAALEAHSSDPSTRSMTIGNR